MKPTKFGLGRSRKSRKCRSRKIPVALNCSAFLEPDTFLTKLSSLLRISNQHWCWLDPSLDWKGRDHPMKSNNNSKMKRNEIFWRRIMKIDKKCNKNSCWREYATLRNVVTGGASDCDKAIYGKIMFDHIAIINIAVVLILIFRMIITSIITLKIMTTLTLTMKTIIIIVGII